MLDRALLNPMGEKVYSADVAQREEQVKNDLASACITRDRRPSVETSLHNCMSAHFVVHLHPTLVNGLMCSRNAESICRERFPDALYIEYTDPGYTLFKKVYDRMAAFKAARGHEPQIIFLQNMGNMSTYNAHDQTGFFAAAAILVGGATVTKATIPNCFIGVLLLHRMYIVVPRAGQNIFGDGNIGEYFRQFIGYGVIALSLVIHAWRTKRQAEHNREALHTAAEGEAK